jgi:hypothetical protein
MPRLTQEPKMDGNVPRDLPLQEHRDFGEAFHWLASYQSGHQTRKQVRIVISKGVNVCQLYACRVHCKSEPRGNKFLLNFEICQPLEQNAEERHSEPQSYVMSPDYLCN